MTTSSLPEILTALSSLDDAELRAAGALHLAAFVDAVSGSQAAALGEYMRSAGAIRLFAELLDDEDSRIPQRLLGTMANLCSNAYDPNSALTKILLRDCACVERLLRHLLSTDAATQLMATAALQNMCSDAELAHSAVALGAHTWLDEIVCSDAGGEQLRRFATGALLNIRDTVTIEQGAEEQGPGGAVSSEVNRAAPVRQPAGAGQQKLPPQQPLRRDSFRRRWRRKDAAHTSAGTARPPTAASSAAAATAVLGHTEVDGGSPQEVRWALPVELSERTQEALGHRRGEQSEERLKLRMREKMAQWRSEREARGWDEAAAAEEHAGACDDADADLEAETRSDSGSSLKSFLSSSVSSAASYFTACSSGGGSTSGAAPASAPPRTDEAV